MRLCTQVNIPWRFVHVETGTESLFSAFGSVDLKCLNLGVETGHALPRELYCQRATFAASGSGLWIFGDTGYTERADDIGGIINNVIIGTFDRRTRVEHCQEGIGVSFQIIRQYISFDTTPNTIANGRVLDTYRRPAKI
jgi:hypothetical protein